MVEGGGLCYGSDGLRAVFADVGGRAGVDEVELEVWDDLGLGRGGGCGY